MARKSASINTEKIPEEAHTGAQVNESVPIESRSPAPRREGFDAGPIKDPETGAIRPGRYKVKRRIGVLDGRPEVDEIIVENF